MNAQKRSYASFCILFVASFLLASCTLKFQWPVVRVADNATPVPAVTTVATPPIGGTPEPLAGGCPQARDLGPWAPSASGEGQTFEVTASDQGASNLSSAGVVLGLWWPAGTKNYGVKEITTFIPRGLSITVIAGAGRGWDFERTCSDAEVNGQMNQHIHDRPNDTTYFGFVAVEELIAKGLVEIRFDRRGSMPQPTIVAQNPTMIAPKATTALSGTGGGTTSAVCNATRFGDSDNLSSITAPANATYSVEAWGGALGDAFVVVPAGESVNRNWQGGAIWAYPCNDTAAILADVSNRGKTIYLVVNGQLVKQ